MKTDKFKIILVSGKAGSGKDTVAHRLVDYHGFKRVGYADYLKDMCTDILDHMECQVQRAWMDDPIKKEHFITDLDGNIFMFQAGGKKDYGLTYRQFLRIVGTECFRDTVHSDIWLLPVQKFIRETLNTGMYNGVVIPDCRFPNEIEGIERYCVKFGKLVEIMTVRVIRPGINEDNIHRSETSLDDYEFTIGLMNDGTIAELFAKVDRVATGSWKLDKLNAEVAKRERSGILSKYQQQAQPAQKDKADGQLQHDPQEP